jgi:hypothetical protein
MKVDNTNILSLGLAKAKSFFLNFFYDKINRTTIFKFTLGNGQETPQIISPDGTWQTEIRVFCVDPPTDDSFELTINGVMINVYISQQLNDNNTWNLILAGQPYLQREDSLHIFSRMGADTEFQFIFHRVMFNNE